MQEISCANKSNEKIVFKLVEIAIRNSAINLILRIIFLFVKD